MTTLKAQAIALRFRRTSAPADVSTPTADTDPPVMPATRLHFIWTCAHLELEL
jgi:hypothetical protein